MRRFNTGGGLLSNARTGLRERAPEAHLSFTTGVLDYWISGFADCESMNETLHLQRFNEPTCVRRIGSGSASLCANRAAALFKGLPGPGPWTIFREMSCRRSSDRTSPRQLRPGCTPWQGNHAARSPTDDRKGTAISSGVNGWGSPAEPEEPVGFAADKVSATIWRACVTMASRCCLLVKLSA